MIVQVAGSGVEAVRLSALMMAKSAALRVLGSMVRIGSTASAAEGSQDWLPHAWKPVLHHDSRAASPFWAVARNVNTG